MSKLIKKIMILGIVFVAAIVAVFFLTREDKSSTFYRIMEDATLPIVNTGVGQGTYNNLHGYTAEMEAVYLWNSITPVPADRQLPIEVNTYGNTITGISYEVRSLDTTRLVERTSLQEWTENEGTITAALPIQNLIFKDTEYVLTLIISTNKVDKIYYYTRILWSDNSHVDEFITFAKDFSQKTFDPVAAKDLTTYLESNNQGNNSSLGNVTINSSFSQLTWAGLTVTKEQDPMVTLLDINGPLGYVKLNYVVQIPTELGTSQRYEIEESFCLKWTAQRLYLMSYNRTMNQIFEVQEDSFSGKKINLGISSGQGLESKVSSSSNYTAFLVNRELWSYDQKANQAVEIFSFRSKEEDGVRSDFDQYDMKIVSVDDKGNIDFLVYGYMNRGDHEGKVAIILYRYREEDNGIEELFCIPSTKPYQYLKENLGTLSYVSSNDMLYMMFGSSIYAIDLIGNEFLVITDKLMEGGYTISSNSKMLAWQEGDSLYSSKTINLMNLDTGHKEVILSKEGEVLRTLGFVNEDFIYGTVRENEIIMENNQIKDFPMYALEIVDENKVLETRYEKNDIYITGVTVQGSRIHLDRVTRSATGGFDKIGEDTLVSNVPMDENADTGIATTVSNTKRMVYYVGLRNPVPEGQLAKISTPKKVVRDTSSIINLTEDKEQEDSLYYAYANGDLKGIYGTYQMAVNAVYNEMGIVIDSKQQKVWVRGNRSLTKSIPIETQLFAAPEDNQVAACVEAILRKEGMAIDVRERINASESVIQILESSFYSKVIDATGCTISQVLFFVNEGNPVLAMTGSGQAVLITGFDQYNVSIFNPVTRAITKMGLNDAGAYFTSRENVFYCYLKQ